MKLYKILKYYLEFIKLFLKISDEVIQVQIENSDLISLPKFVKSIKGWDKLYNIFCKETWLANPDNKKLKMSELKTNETGLCFTLTSGSARNNIGFYLYAKHVFNDILHKEWYVFTFNSFKCAKDIIALLSKKEEVCKLSFALVERKPIT